MAIEFISSFIGSGSVSEQDPEYPVRAAARDAEAGFDKLILGFGASAPDGLLVASEVLTTTSRLGVVVEHIPGLVAPTVAARQYATLAAFHRDRVGMHVLTGPDVDPLRGRYRAPPGRDQCKPAACYRRTAEFVEVVRLAWRSPAPFDYRGEFYQVAGASAPVSAVGQDLPVYCSGESSDAMRLGAAQSDVYLFAAAPAAVISRRIATLAALATGHGTSPRIGVSLRLTAAPAGRAAVEVRGGPASGSDQVSWIPSASLADAPGGRLRMVGEYDQIADVLLEYAQAGVGTLVIGHDPLADADACAAVIAGVRAG